jgi:hypothetical protein
VIEQVPEVIGVTMEPLTEQTLAVVEANVTTKPELAVAVSVRGGEGSVIPPTAAKVMA